MVSLSLTLTLITYFPALLTMLNYAFVVAALMHCGDLDLEPEYQRGLYYLYLQNVLNLENGILILL
jgi:hypothetical protein